MWSGEVETLAPQALARAVEHQLVVYPDDEAVLSRLVDYLNRSNPTLREIAEAVCEQYCITPHDLMGRGRLAETVLARQFFCYMAHRYTRFSLGRIGKALDGRDHTTVRHSVLKITHEIACKPLFADDVDLLRLRIAEKVLRRPIKARSS